MTVDVPEGLDDKRLQFDHSLCHTLFIRKREVPDSVSDWSFEDLVDYHWLIKAILKKRGITHYEQDELDGIDVGRSTIQAIDASISQIRGRSLYLPAPHSHMIWTGKKRLIVKNRNYGGMLNRPLYWADSENVYGILKFTDIEPITIEKFLKMQPLHLVSDEERKRWWGDSKQLYAYRFKIMERFKQPSPYEYRRGTQVFFGMPVWKTASELTIAFDLDGTIADTDFSKPIPEAFTDAKPFEGTREALEQIQEMVRVIIHTARESRYAELTTNWLQRYDIPYDELILGKPMADIYIGDLEVPFERNWGDIVGLVTAANEFFIDEKQISGIASATAIDATLPHAQQQATVKIQKPSVMRKLHDSTSTGVETMSTGVEYVFIEGEVVNKASLMQANKPAKRYYELDDLPKFLSKYPRVLVEQKFDGMDVMLSRDHFWSGRGLDKTKRVPHIMEELKNWSHKSFIMHGQAMMYEDNKPLHRTAVIGYINSSAPTEEGKDLRVVVFDLLELDGDDLRDVPILERLETLRREFRNSEHIHVIERSQYEMASPKELPRICRKLGNLPSSEGAMLFDPQSKWNKTRNVNFGWAKWKKQQELDVLVIKKERKENGWRYLGAIGPLNKEGVQKLPESKVAQMKGKNWLLMGHTHVSDVDVAEGDILRVRVLEVVRNDEYDFSYQNAVPMYPPEKKVPDGLDVAADLASATLRKNRHSRFKCMECDESPVVDVLWAEGMARAWFCDKHFEEWKKGTYSLRYGGEDHVISHEEDICHVYKVKDEVPEKWSDHRKQLRSKADCCTSRPEIEVYLNDGNTLSLCRRHYREWHYKNWSIEQSFVQLQDTMLKQFASDPASGAQIVVPGRTTEGISTTGIEQPSQSIAPFVGNVPGLEKIKDVEDYSPQKIPTKVLLDDHRITHAWWATLQSGKPLIHDKATVRALHGGIAREIKRRGYKHNSPLGMAKSELLFLMDDEFEKAYTVAPGGIVGVPGMGAGERVPDSPDKTFPETSPAQYVNSGGQNLVVHTRFRGPNANNLAEDWLRKIRDLAQAQGLKIDAWTEPCEGSKGGIVGTVIIDTSKPIELRDSIFELQKQLWPAWVGRRVDPHTGRPLPSERKPVKITPNESRKQMPPEESTTKYPIRWGASPQHIEQSTSWSLKFLGTSGDETFPRTDCNDAQCREDRRLNSAIIYASDDTRILCDLGSEELWARVGEKPDAICITHAHSDHVHGLPHADPSIPVYMHRDTWRDLKKEAPSIRKELVNREVHLYGTRNTVKIGSVKLRWLPVKHSVRVNTFALRFDKHVLYSPDFLSIEDEWLRGVDCWVIDGASMSRNIEHGKKEKSGHQSIMNSLEQAKRSGISEVIVTHVGHTGLKHEYMAKAIEQLAKEIGYDGHVVLAKDLHQERGDFNKADAGPREGEPYPAEMYKGPSWLHTREFTYILHHHFPYGPLIKDGTIVEGTAKDIHITGPPPASAGGRPPKDAISAPRNPAEAENYVARELGIKKDVLLDDDEEKGIGGFREHWETRQDTGADTAIGWTFLTYPWVDTRRFFIGNAKGMCVAKPAIPKTSSKEFPRGWFDVQGLRKPVVLGGTAGAGGESRRAGFYEILEESTFRYGLQRNNVHEYFFNGKLLNGRLIFRLLKLASGSTRWLAFRPPDQKAADPEKHEDSGHWRLVGETEAPVESPRGEKL